MKKLFPLLLLIALLGFAYVYKGSGNRRLNSAAASGAQMRREAFYIKNIMLAFQKAASCI